jgi:hypothetical protein
MHDTDATGAWDKYELAMQLESESSFAESAKKRWELFNLAAQSGLPEAMLKAGEYLECGIGTAGDAEQAAEWYRKAAKIAPTYCGYGWFFAWRLSRNRSDLLRSADVDLDSKDSIEVAKELIRNREGYAFSSYRFRGQWERENAEFDGSFAKGIDLLESILSSDSLNVVDRVEVLTILADLYWDGRIRCAAQFNPIDDIERLEVALDYYTELAQLNVNADERIKEYYKNIISRIPMDLKRILDEQDAESE